MNTDGEILTSNNKRKKRQKHKDLQQQSSVFENVPQPLLETISPAPSSTKKESPNATFSTDFPALPNQSANKTESEPLHYGTTVSFSKILVKPKIQFTNTKFVNVQETNTRSNSSFRGGSCSINVNKIINERELNLLERNFNSNYVHKSENIGPTVQSSSSQKTTVQPTKNYGSIGILKPPDVPNIQPQEAKPEKKKRKKRPKKILNIQKGKVLTLTREQYEAITEPNRPISKTLAHKLNINDENEYPEIGIQRSGSGRADKLPTEQNKTLQPKIKDNEDQEKSSPGASPISPSDNSAKKDLAKKFNTPIEMNILDMLSTKKKPEKKLQKLQTLCVRRVKVKIPGLAGAPNALDSSGPTIKRGKEREAPRKPKISKLKKIILKERTEKKLKRVPASEDLNSVPVLDGGLCEEHVPESEIEVQLENIKLEPGDSKNGLTPSKTCVEFHMPQTTIKTEEKVDANIHLKCAKRLLHCRKFREYCSQFISEDIDTLTEKLLEELVRFQDRLYLKDPVKATSKRRIICGLREVTKNLKLRKLKLVIMAPDIEEIQSKGGLNDALQNILKFSTEFFTPLIFSLPRKKLGKACKKKSPLCCVGILNYEGAEEIYKNLMELIKEAKRAYQATLENVKQNLTQEIIAILQQDELDHLLLEQLKRSFWSSQNIC